MELAAACVRSGELSLREASATYGVPQSIQERQKNKKLLNPGCLGLLSTRSLTQNWLIIVTLQSHYTVSFVSQQTIIVFWLTVVDVKLLASAKNRLHALYLQTVNPPCM